MPIDVLMPALSPTMTEGTLAKWHKKEGDKVASGDVIAEIETDKATMEVEAADEGTLAKIVVPAGTEGVKVNAVIAILTEEGEDASAVAAPKAAPKTEAPKPEPKKAEAPEPAAPAPQKAAPAPSPSGGRVFASPLAKRLAAESGVDISRVPGSGPHGRVVKADVEQAKTSGIAAAPTAASGPTALATIAAKAPPIDASMPFDEAPNSTVRKIIARRLLESKRDIPHFYLTVDCRIDALMGMRKQLNDKAPEGAGAYKLSVNDFVIRAAALALRKVPAANATWTEEAIRLYQNVDISVAVATPAGLITPIVRRADNKGLAAISNEMRDLAARARDGKLKPEEFQGGGFSISNLGMFGIREFSAIINPPQSCILAVGAAEQRPAVVNGALAIATMMTCTLSVDHRSVDGAVGAQFLQAFKALIEEPLTMML